MADPKPKPNANLPLTLPLTWAKRRAARVASAGLPGRVPSS